jgi:glutamine synthetase
MPKPLFGDNGGGMLPSIAWKVTSRFGGDGCRAIETLFYIGGLLKHAATIVAFATPPLRSYNGSSGL